MNTIRGLELDPGTLRPRLARGVGGYSGPGLKPIALAAVYAAFRVTKLPIVGMGGIASGRDAAEFLAAGASAIALGTALFADPGAPARIRRELAETAASFGFADPIDLRGIAHEPDSDLLPPILTTTKTTCISRELIALDKLLVSRAVASVKTQAQAPARSRDQRMEALQRANDIRVKRAQLKRDLKNGDADIEKILEKPPEYVATAKVFDILMAVPKFGRVKATRFLTQARISQSKTVGGLSDRQRAELIGLFRR